MPREYTCSFEGQSVTNANGDYELFELDPATDIPIELVAMELWVTSELQEAQEEWLRLAVIRGHATDGTGGTSTTPRPLDPKDAAAGFTCDVLRTAIASTGTPVTLAAPAMNVRAGYSWGPVPIGYGYRITAAEGLLVVRLVAAVTDDVTMSGWCTVVEV